QLLQIQQGEKVDCAKFPVPGRLATDSSSHSNIRLQQSWNPGSILWLFFILRQNVCGSRFGAKFQGSKIKLKLVVNRPALCRILRIERGAANQIAQAIQLRIPCNSTPKQCQYFARAMLAINGSATQLKHLRLDKFVRSEIKFLCAVKAPVAFRFVTGLHPIGPDDFTR